MKSEFERRSRLEARGQTVTTTSGALLTILVGVAALVTGDKYTFGSQEAVVVLGISFVFFVVASALGIATQHAFPTYSSTSLATLDEMVDGHWDDDATDAQWICARRHVATIKSLRQQNARKARLALAAPVAQLIAFILLSTAILVEVWA